MVSKRKNQSCRVKTRVNLWFLREKQRSNENSRQSMISKRKKPKQESENKSFKLMVS